MQRTSDEFQAAVNELRKTLSIVLTPLVDDERGLLLYELMENQLKGVEKFYALLIADRDARVAISEEDFYLIIDKYRPVLKFFTRLPKENEKSTHNLSVITEFYFLLRYYARDGVGSPRSAGDL